MPALLIQLVNNQWFASVANTNIQYRFAGQFFVDQVQCVRALAQAMNVAGENVAALAQNIGNALVFPQEVQGMVVVNNLFAGTDTVVLGTRVIYGVVGDEFLLDDLDGAGTALLLALA